MAEKILITGGAGFIGTHVTRALLDRGYEIRVLDSLVEQVHGPSPIRSIRRHVEFTSGDLRDPDAVARALVGVDRVVHLAAEVGVGQSMYEVERYVGANDLGTAVLMQALIARPVARIAVASSMSIYGEGLYRRPDGGLVEDAKRAAATAPGAWDPLDRDGTLLVPVATPEAKRPSLASVYALTKYVQERLTLNVAAAYGMEAVALRLFNVFGPGQALSNPYTGVLAIFASRLLNGQRPLLFEDGRQRRDFVHVEDVAAAFVAALEHPGIAGEVFNVGSGRDVTILEVGEALAAAMERRDLAPEVTGRARFGDVRHCFADISYARERLGFAPRRGLDESLPALVEWIAGQQAEDRVAQASRELEARGLVA